MNKTMNKTMNVKEWLDKKGDALLRHSDPEVLEAVATHMAKTIYKSTAATSTIIASAVDYDTVSGKIDIIVPLTAKPDAAGFARMKALQYGKKELIRRQLLEKLAKRKGLSGP